MPGDPLQYVNPGDKLRIDARSYNAFVEAARAHQRGENDTSAGVPGSIDKNATVVWVKNASGADAARFAALGVDVPVFTPADNEEEFANRVVLSCITPAAAHVGRFVILLEPLANGAIGRAVISGLVRCKINVVRTEHMTCDVEDGETQLYSRVSGLAQIVWKESGTGADKWAVVRIGVDAPRPIVGRCANDFPKNSSGSVEVLHGAKGSETTTGETITAWNGFSALIKHARVHVDVVDGAYELSAGDCEATTTTTTTTPPPTTTPAPTTTTPAPTTTTPAPTTTTPAPTTTTPAPTTTTPEPGACCLDGPEVIATIFVSLDLSGGFGTDPPCNCNSFESFELEDQGGGLWSGSTDIAGCEESYTLEIRCLGEDEMEYRNTICGDTVGWLNMPGGSEVALCNGEEIELNVASDGNCPCGGSLAGVALVQIQFD